VVFKGEAMSGKEGIKTSIAKPDKGNKLKAIIVFHFAVDSLTRLMIQDFISRSKAITLVCFHCDTNQRNDYKNQR